MALNEIKSPARRVVERRILEYGRAKAKGLEPGRIRMSKDLVQEVIEVRRVYHGTKGGRAMRYRACCAVGNLRGKVGVGVGRSIQVGTAIANAAIDAEKNMVSTPLTENGSIQHDIFVKVKASKVQLRARHRSNCGLKYTGGVISTVLKLAGVKNCTSKQMGNRNRIHNARATIFALQLQATLEERASDNGRTVEEQMAFEKAQRQKDMMKHRGKYKWQHEGYAEFLLRKDF